jgi:hypothetical protein
MRLFGKLDTAINRFDRAQYLTAPFDGAFAAPVAALPERTFAAPPRGTTFDARFRGTTFSAAPRGTCFRLETS